MRTPAAVALTVLVGVAACSGGTSRSAGPQTTRQSDATVTTATTAPTTTTSAPVDLGTAPPVPTSPAEVATMYVGAQDTIHDAAVPDGDRRVARAGHVAQVAMRALAGHPEWDADVLARLPAAYRPAAVDDAAAGRDLRALVRAPKPDLPAWTIVDAAPADELRRYYEEGQSRFGVPWQYLAAVNLTETRMGRLRGTSTSGAQGPMQFLPNTWAAYGGGGDIQSNHDAIIGAARYLAANGGGRGDLHNALYRYNPTEKYVRAVTRYAERMRADPMAYRGYWGWQVYYWSTLGDVWLRPGWSLAAPAR